MVRLRNVLLVILLGGFLLFWMFPQVFYIPLNKKRLFREAAGGLYVLNSTSLETENQLKWVNKSAAKRIRSFWGEKRGNAEIFYCPDAALYQQLCQSPKGSGCSVITPFGSWIILNVNGLNTDVLAHEMCHDETATRIGWWQSRTRLPKWMDEGLALQLDNRFVSATDSLQRYIDYKAELTDFSMNNQLQIPLDELQTDRQFYGGDAVYTQLAYLTSATEVARLIANYGRREVIRNMINEKEFLPEKSL